MKPFDGKIAIVTGAADGFGEGIAPRLFLSQWRDEAKHCCSDDTDQKASE